MKQKKVLRPRCIDCEFRFASFGDNNTCAEGIVLKFGKQYCSYGKKYREFRKKDPKVYPPSWCPRLKIPSEFRIYDFKDTNAWFLYQMSKNSSAPPSYRCAVRIVGTTQLSPVDFYREALVFDVSTLLGVEVHSGEIIEIDDGLIPYCFYFKHRSVEVLTHWCPEKARCNTYLSDQTVLTRIAETEGDASSSMP